jgi:hypothetical protein
MSNREATARYRARHPERVRESARLWRLANTEYRNRKRVEYQQEIRARLADIKLERGCTDCEYRAHAEALDFDHLPEHEKAGTVSRIVSSWSWARIEAELEKCEVVCANCHRVRTAARR